MSRNGEIALQYAERGLPVFPCSSDTKRPLLRKPPGDTKGGFHIATTDGNKIEKWWRHHPEALIGLRTGPQSGFFVIDIDPRNGGDASLVEAKQKLGNLPDTLVVNTASGGRHLYFKWRESFEQLTIDEGGLGPGLDWRGDGGYVIAAGSASRSLGEWKCSSKAEVAELPERWEAAMQSVRRNDAEYILRVMADEQTKVLEGYRDSTLTSVAGHLRNKGMGFDGICERLLKINEHQCTPPMDQEQVRKIAKSISKKPAGTDFIAPSEVEMVGAEFAYVIEIERFVSRRDSSLKLSKAQLADYFKRPSNFSKKILNHPDMPTAMRLTFEPGRGDICQEDFEPWVTHNIWRPSGIDSKPGDVSLFLDHAAYLMPDMEVRDHVLNFMAHIVQRPADKIRHAIVMCGAEGVGKSYLAFVMERVLGGHNVRIVGMPELQSSFNAWMEGVQLVRVEEVMMLGRMELMNKLKPLITEDSITINQKNLPTYTIPNRVNLMLFSNHDDALRIGDGDRRYYVIQGPQKAHPSEYYPHLFDWTRGNVSELKYYLESRDITGFNAQVPPPVTHAKRLMIKYSQDPLTALVMDLIDSGRYPFEKDLVSTTQVLEALCTDPTAKGLKLNHITVGKVLRELSKDVSKVISPKSMPKGRYYAIRNIAEWSKMVQYGSWTKMVDESEE